MSLFTRPVTVGLIIYSNCCLLQWSKTRKGGCRVSGCEMPGPVRGCEPATGAPQAQVSPQGPAGFLARP